MWLRDRIPHAQPNARIFLYEYNSSPVFGSSQRRFSDEANQFLEYLRLKRRKDTKRPLLLLGHSLGGILIKQALVNAINNPRFHDIQVATYGLIFFGTPHGGPGDGWQIMFGKASVRIAQSLPGMTSNDIMEALKKGSLFSHTLQDQWRHQLDQYQIVTFYEGIGDVKAFITAIDVGCANAQQVVPQHSATLGLPGDRESQIRIQAKHGDLCRFDPDVVMDERNYELVEGNVLELCEMASQIGETNHPTMDTKQEKASNPTSPTDSNATLSVCSHEVGDLERRLYLLRK